MTLVFHASAHESGRKIMMKRIAASVAAALTMGGTAFATPFLAPPAGPKVTFKANGNYEVSEAFLMEMACVQDRMTQRMWDDYGAVLVLNGDNPVSKVAAAAALDDCVSEHLWGDAERLLADQMAQNTAIWDFQNLELSAIKITPETLQAAWGSLSADDRRHFMDAGWNNDAPFVARVEAALTANGVRNNAEVLETARIALGAFTYMAITRDRWVQRYR